MYNRKQQLFLWGFYLAAALALGLLQILLAGWTSHWQVVPFLLPLLVAVCATYETHSAFFALLMGLCADSILAVPFPCCYTLCFPPLALLISSMARWLLSPGFLCSLAACVLLFTGMNGVILLYFRLQYASALLPLCRTAAMELLLSLPALLLVHPLCTWIHTRCGADDS